MNFVARVIETASAMLVAFVLVLAVLAYFGSDPITRYSCDLQTDNPVAMTMCIVQTTPQN